jgi:CubicO group peptidase (beta-lactamase class C family)
MAMRLRSALAVSVLLLTSVAQSDPADAFLTTDLPSYLDQVRTTFNVPGLAVAIVKDGKVLFAQGSGIRDLRDRKPVDADTMFCIASNTKSVTATAIEILADEGKLHLDDRVTDHLPWFQMADPYVTHDIRIRDLLAHRSGLGPHAGDLLFVPATTYTLRQVVEHLKDLPLQSGFRSEFAYENIMFAVATLIIEQASGQRYAEFVQQRIFMPLKMSESRIDGASLKAADNYAAAFMPLPDGSLQSTPVMVWKNNQGAGGIYSSVRDMSRWAQMQLRSPDVPALVSEKSQNDMWSMVTPIPITPESDPELHRADPQFQGYALGWYLSDYRGQRLVWHTGGFPGTVSLVTLVPGQHLGIIVLTNQESESAFNAIQLQVLDHYLNAPATDWLQTLSKHDRQAQQRLGEASARQAGQRVANAKPSLPLQRYAGSYHDAWYGDVELRLERGQLRARFDASPRLIGTLSAWGDNTFLIQWDDRTLQADALVTFDTDSAGQVTGASMQRASPRVTRAYDYQDLHLIRTAPLRR